MRLALISDIHGNLTALQAVLDDMERCGEFDLIWCLGDLAALGGQPHECVQALISLREKHGEDMVKIIGGNTDRYLVTGARIAFSPPAEAENYPAYRDNILSMSAINAWNMQRLNWDDFQLLRDILGPELKLPVEGYGSVIGFHAIPGDDESVALRPDSPDEEAADALLDRGGRLALCGHTHHALDRQLDSWRVINPGSVGLSFGLPGLAEWALLEWQDGELSVDFRRVPYDVDATLREWKKLGYPEIDWIRPRLGA
jgi:predicted phosphodiesterase